MMSDGNQAIIEQPDDRLAHFLNEISKIPKFFRKSKLFRKKR